MALIPIPEVGQLTIEDKKGNKTVLHNAVLVDCEIGNISYSEPWKPVEVKVTWAMPYTDLVWSKKPNVFRRMWNWLKGRSASSGLPVITAWSAMPKVQPPKQESHNV